MGTHVYPLTFFHVAQNPLVVVFGIKCPSTPDYKLIIDLLPLSEVSTFVFSDRDVEASLYFDLLAIDSFTPLKPFGKMLGLVNQHSCGNVWYDNTINLLAK